MPEETKETAKKSTSKKSTKKAEKEFNIEQALARLEEINSELGRSGTSLKDSMALYKEGVLLADEAKKNLEGVEKEIKILSEEG